jgi:alkylation response protein AidB-like acyl-CoA dehydrogenase
MTVPSVEMLFIAGRAVFLVFSFILVAIAFSRWRRAIHLQTGVVLANHEVVLHRLADLEARVTATNVAVSQLTERSERPRQLASTSVIPTQGYQIAIRLAKGGASRDELIAGCGLSTHEAELVHRLHAPQSKASTRKPLASHSDAA